VLLESNNIFVCIDAFDALDLYASTIVLLCLLVCVCMCVCYWIYTRVIGFRDAFDAFDVLDLYASTIEFLDLQYCSLDLQ